LVFISGKFQQPQKLFLCWKNGLKNENRDKDNFAYFSPHLSLKLLDSRFRGNDKFITDGFVLFAGLRLLPNPAYTF
jgi:hypothetical protein